MTQLYLQDMLIT